MKKRNLPFHMTLFCFQHSIQYSSLSRNQKLLLSRTSIWLCFTPICVKEKFSVISTVVINICVFIADCIVVESKEIKKVKKNENEKEKRKREKPVVPHVILPTFYTIFITES